MIDDGVWGKKGIKKEEGSWLEGGQGYRENGREMRGGERVVE